MYDLSTMAFTLWAASMTPVQLWLRIPVLLRAIVGGLAVGLLGTGAWTMLIATNITHWSRVPWAAPVMALILGAWWQYFVRGHGWPAATAEARRLNARANRVPDHLWGPA